MKPTSAAGPTVFDSYSHDYETVLDRGLAVSGEDSRYFARERVRWLARRLGELAAAPRSILDYGCGKGTSTPLFFELLGVTRVVGTDASPTLLAKARELFGSQRATFLPPSACASVEKVDLVYCNGVFHHIEPAARPAALGELTSALKPGGLVAIWENNPWSLAARYVMSRVAFDRDAVMLSAGTTRRLLEKSGCEILSTNFLFIFPRFLSALRPLEPMLSALPLGSQYQVLGRKR
jgi:trans-aconitate methyltransferase